MKKVWIASIFVILMLMIPFTNVVGTSEVGEDCNCKPINDIQVVRIERLLDRLESRINFILLKYGDIPEVAEKNEEIYDKISTLKEINNELKLNSSLLDFPNICSILDNYFNLLWDIREKISDIYWFFIFFTFVSVLIEMIMTFIWTIGFVLGCWNWPV